MNASSRADTDNHIQHTFSHFSVFLMIIIDALTEMQEDLPIILLHTQLVFAEKLLVLLLFDLCHYILSFLWRETVQSGDFSCDTWRSARSSLALTRQILFIKTRWQCLFGARYTECDVVSCVFSCMIQYITYCRWEFNAVVQITEPEEVSEAMCDVKWIELLISEVQKSQDVDVVLIASANTATFIARTHF